MAVFRYRLQPGLYRDSVTLMQLSAHLLAQPGVQQATALMATPANREALASSGWPDELMSAEFRPNDLLLAVEGQTEAEVVAALDWADLELRHPSRPGPASPSVNEHQSHTLAEGLRRLPEASVVSISVPGEYAYGEALKALKAGRHVFLFSSGVTLEDEVRLKQVAASRNLLMMGAECGTGLIAGVPLGFANVVRRGGIGLVAASGSGLQEVMCLIHTGGGGVSHAIGVGGRDLHERVGGLTTLAGLKLLHADADTAAIVLLSKPPAPRVAERILAEAAQLTKPCVVAFLGSAPASFHALGLNSVATLEEAARAALKLIGLPASDWPVPVVPRVQPPRCFVRGLFAGGTLCGEATQILSDAGPVVTSFADEGWPASHVCLDLGDEVYTRGRPHPMIDARLRADKLRQAAHDPQTGVVLFDIILGHGASPDPVGPLLEAIPAGPDGPVYIAHVCGTDADPQNLYQQESRLRQAGVWVAPTNAAAARLAMEVIRL